MADQPPDHLTKPVLDLDYATPKQSLQSVVDWGLISRIGIGILVGGLILIMILAVGSSSIDLGVGLSFAGVCCVIIARTASNKEIHVGWRITISLATVVYISSGARLFYSTGFNFIWVCRHWDIYRLDGDLLRSTRSFLIGILAAAAFRSIAWMNRRKRSQAQESKMSPKSL